MYGICSQPVEKLTALQEKLGLGVTLLSDPAGEAIRTFHMTDPKGIPDPNQARAGSFLLDRDGRVLCRWLTTNYRERPSADEILRIAPG